MQKTETEQHTLDKCPDWVRQHSDWKQPWNPAGRAQALAEINGWNAEYAPQLRDENPIPPLKDDASLTSRLWNCLINHWGNAEQEGSHSEIVKKLIAGVNPKTKQDLGGNPLFDLVLADALCNGQGKAAKYYWEKIVNNKEIRGVAKKWHKKYGVSWDDKNDEYNDSDWATAFYHYLALKENRKLDDYQGHLGLIGWLARCNVLRNFLTGYHFRDVEPTPPNGIIIKRGSSMENDSGTQSWHEGLEDEKSGTPRENAEKKELEELACACMDEALNRRLYLENYDEWRRIRYSYRERMTDAEVAKKMSREEYESVDTSRRRRIKAEKNLKKIFFEELHKIKSLHTTSFVELSMEVVLEAFYEILEVVGEKDENHQ
jgi:hypothetical protein